MTEVQDINRNFYQQPTCRKLCTVYKRLSCRKGIVWRCTSLEILSTATQRYKK